MNRSVHSSSITKDDMLKTVSDFKHVFDCFDSFDVNDFVQLPIKSKQKKAKR